VGGDIVTTVTQPEGITLGGHWVLTLIMIVIGFWIFFVYLALRSLAKWRNAGVLQRFFFFQL